MTGPFPELATPRLREMTEADAPTYRAPLHFPEVTRYSNLAVDPTRRRR
jgi:hypothetical protein